jgi:plastocyanin
MRLTRFPHLAGAALVLLSWAATCVPATQADDNRIAIKDFMFVPTSLSVAAGATVTWSNQDDEPHTVTSDTGLFHSGALDTRESFSFRFDKPGTYHFICSIHPRMVGTIIVR